MGRLLEYFMNKWPYTDFHELNADWLLSSAKELVETMDSFIQNESISFADPIVWNITTQYTKATVVIDTSGNAYLSKQPVPSGIQLNNNEYWQEIFNFTNYTRTANRNLTVNVETNTTRATSPYSVDDWLIWNDVLYKVTTAIAIDDILITSPAARANIVHFTVEDFIKAWINTMQSMYNSFAHSTNLTIQQYKNDIDASELAFTTNLQTQFNAAIAGVTVDSEVILARVGWNGYTYSTLGDAIRGQIYDIFKHPATINYLNKDDYIEGHWFNTVTTPNAELQEASYLFCSYVRIDRAGMYYFKYPVASVGTNSYKVALFNADKTYNQVISGTYLSGSGNETLITLNITNAMITAGVTYIGYVQGMTKVTDNDMICIGSYPDTYIKFNNYVTRPDLLVDQSQIKLAGTDEELEDILDSYFAYPTIINYLDRTKTVKGYWINNVTQSPPIIEPLSGMNYTLVRIYKSGLYYLKYPVASMGTNNYKVSLYDINGNYNSNISGVFVSGSGNNTIVTLNITDAMIRNGVAYIGYNQGNTRLYADDMVCIGSYPANYIPYNCNTKTSPDLRLDSSQIIYANPLSYKGHSASMFTKGFFAGDSLTKGTFNRKENGATIFEVIEKYSYVEMFKKLTGVNAVNWGIGGENTKSYYELITQETIAADYDFVVIALGANDVALNDIPTSTTYYQLLIDHFKSLWNGVKIFCCTVTPAYTETNPTFYDDYNDMVRDMVANNTNCFLIDLAAYSECKLNTPYTNGHLTAIGYMKQAEEVANAISYYVDQQMYNFNDTQFIGTNYHA